MHHRGILKPLLNPSQQHLRSKSIPLDRKLFRKTSEKNWQVSHKHTSWVMNVSTQASKMEKKKDEYCPKPFIAGNLKLSKDDWSKKFPILGYWPQYLAMKPIISFQPHTNKFFLYKVYILPRRKRQPMKNCLWRFSQSKLLERFLTWSINSILALPKTGGLSPIINLKNKFVRFEHFRVEQFRVIKALILPLQRVHIYRYPFTSFIKHSLSNGNTLQ